MIGYDPMKPSIYVEEWGERFKNLNIREVSLIIDPTGEKIQIAQMKGKYVRPTEKNLMHYLRISPFNKDNHAKDSEFREEQPKVTASYYELNFEKQAKTRRTSDKEQTKAKALVYESDYEAKKAYCVAKGINTKAPDGAPLSDAELEDMLAYRAEKDPETFQKEYNTPEIWNAFYIRKAIERGYLSEKDGGRVLVDSTGNVVKSAPVSQRAIDALAKGAATNNANDAYYANTGLSNGDPLPGLVGFEWDAVVNNGFTPPGLTILGESIIVPEPGIEIVLAPGLPPGTSNLVSNAVRYTAPSGAKVLSIGSIQWMWGLDGFGINPPRDDLRAQQFAVNVFADMDSYPTTPDPALVIP